MQSFIKEIVRQIIAEIYNKKYIIVQITKEITYFPIEKESKADGSAETKLTQMKHL